MTPDAKEKLKCFALTGAIVVVAFLTLIPVFTIILPLE